MKKINLYTKTIVLLIALVTGCTDVLQEQPRTILTPDFFETGQGLRAGLTAAYAHFRRYYATEGGMNMTVYGTDEYSHGQQVNNPPFAIYGGITPDNGEMGSAWNNAYPAINTCNGIIEIGASATDLPDDEKKQLIAEAKFIRANWYYILVRTFGGVSLDLGAGPLAFNTNPTNDLSRSSEDDVYAAIVQDLEDAVADLPDSRPAPGHAWKASALHLLAKVYLDRGWKNNSTADFQEAYDNAMELINNQVQYDVGLEGSYANVHAEGNEWGKEVLWTVEWNGQDQYNNVNDHGNQHNNGSLFYFREFYVQDVPGMVRDVQNGRPWIRYNPTPWMIDVAFADKVNDERYDASFQTVWYVNSETTNPAPARSLGDTAQWHAPLHVEQSFATPEAAQAWAAGKGYVISFPNIGTATSFQGLGRNYQNKHYPSLSKYDNVNRPVAGTETDPNIASTRPFIVYRFAETFLVAAEAAIKIGNGQAVDLINVVRGRAGALPITEGDLVGAHGDAIDFILDERTRELAGEQMRWFDLKRTGRLLQRVSSNASVGTGTPAVYNRQYNGGAPAAGQGAPLPQPHHLLRPIPQNSMDAVTGDYGQNPGYLGN